MATCIGKRKLKCLLDCAVRDSELDDAEQFPVLAEDKEVRCLSQTPRHAGDDEVRDWDAVILDSSKGSVIDWNKSAADSSLYKFGVNSVEAMLFVEAYKLLNSSCTSLLEDRAGMRDYEDCVRDMKPFVSNEAVLFGQTMSKQAYWPRVIDFGVYSSCLSKLIRFSESTIVEKKLLKAARELFKEVFDNVVTELKGSSIEKNSFILHSLEFVAKEENLDRVILQMAHVARMRTSRNKYAHPFGDDDNQMSEVMEAQYSATLEAYKILLHGTSFMEVGGICLLNLEVRKFNFKAKDRWGELTSEQQYKQDLMKLWNRDK